MKLQNRKAMPPAGLYEICLISTLCIFKANMKGRWGSSFMKELDVSDNHPSSDKAGDDIKCSKGGKRTPVNDQLPRIQASPATVPFPRCLQMQSLPKILSRGLHQNACFYPQFDIFQGPYG